MPVRQPRMAALVRRTTRRLQYEWAAAVRSSTISGTPRFSQAHASAPRRPSRLLRLFLVFEAQLELDPVLHDLAALYAGR